MSERRKLNPRERRQCAWESVRKLIGDNQEEHAVNPFRALARIAIEAGICESNFGCGLPVVQTDFKDELSRTEYGISGLCQSCQDSVFDEDPWLNEPLTEEELKAVETAGEATREF